MLENISLVPHGYHEFKLIEQRERFEERELNFKIVEVKSVVKLTRDDLIELVTRTVQPLAESKLKVLFRSGANGRFEVVIRDTSDKLDVLRVEFCDDDGDGEEYYGDTTIHTGVQDVIFTGVFSVSGNEGLIDDCIELLTANLRGAQDQDRSSLVKWFVPSAHGMRSQTFCVKKTWEMEPLCYPWVKNLKEYYESFLKSTAQILIIYGPPGTGKTSFIRDMICETSSNVSISYDLKVLSSDETFVSYMLDKIYNVFVFEDADELLTSARSDYNKVISKILNISDGLIKVPQKKLIFTTNIPNLADLDSAIIREGRCFDVANFRKLTRTEAQELATKLGTQLAGSKSEYTLAEVYAARSTEPSRTHKVKTRSVGFIPDQDLL